MPSCPRRVPVSLQSPPLVSLPKNRFFKKNKSSTATSLQSTSPAQGTIRRRRRRPLPTKRAASATSLLYSEQVERGGAWKVSRARVEFRRI
jgi:hypothetical protein